MDFFKKIFEKKVCSICGNESGLLGNRKLEDGNLCKECTSKLSPWYEERRHATAHDIERHLGYRAMNRDWLNKLKPTKSLGEYYKIHIGFSEGYPAYFIVSKDADYVEKNADIILMDKLKNCRLDIRETCTELTKLNENKQRVSYIPPRYEYRYDFNVVLEVDLDFCNEIEFKLNKHSVKVEVEKRGNVMADPTRDVQYQYFANMYHDIEYLLVDGMKHAVVMRERLNKKFENTRDKFEEQKRKLEEMQEKILENQAKKAQESQEASIEPKFCPNCGEKNNGGKYCPNCGFYLNK